VPGSHVTSRSLATVCIRGAARALVGEKVAGQWGAQRCVACNGAAVGVRGATHMTFLVLATIKTRACRAGFAAGQAFDAVKRRSRSVANLGSWKGRTVCVGCTVEYILRGLTSGAEVRIPTAAGTASVAR